MPLDRSRYAPRAEVRERTRQAVAGLLIETAPLLASNRSSDVARARQVIQSRVRQSDPRNAERTRATVRQNLRDALDSSRSRTLPVSAAEVVSSTSAGEPQQADKPGSSFLGRFGSILADVATPVVAPVKLGLEGLDRAHQASLGFFTGDNPLDSIQQGFEGLTGQERFSGEDLGFVRHLPEDSTVRNVAGVIGGELVDPSNLLIAGKGASLAARLASRGGRLGRAGAAVLEPIAQGPFARRLAAEAAAGAGFQGASALADKGLEAANAPTPVRAAAGFAAGLVGAGISAHAFSAAWPRAVAGDEAYRDLTADLPIGFSIVDESGGRFYPDPTAPRVAAAQVLDNASREFEDGMQRIAPSGGDGAGGIQGGAGVMAMDIQAARQIAPQSAAFQRALDGLEADGYQEAPSELLRALHMASAVVANDKQGWVSQLADRVPGLSRLVHADRPGLDMPDHVLEAYVAQGAVSAEIAQRSMVSKYEFIQKAREAFGEEALRGEPSSRVRFIGTAEEAAVVTPAGRPLARTLLDIAQRPDLYELTPAQSDALRFGDLRNEELRQLANIGYGTDIRRLGAREGGMHLPQIDIGEEALQRAEAHGRGVRGLMADESQHRLYATVRDRIVNDPQFEPELDVHQLIGALDGEKARRASDNVYRIGLGGKRKAELVAELNPALEARYRDLQGQVRRLRGMSARANEAARRAHAVYRASGEIDAQFIRRENELIKAQMRMRQIESVAEGRFTTDVLPDMPTIQRDLERVKGELERGPDGLIRHTKANDARLELIGELETQYDVRATLDNVGGDVHRAVDSLEEYNKNLGEAFEYRQSLSVRAQAARRTKRQGRLSLRSGFADAANFPDAQGEFALVKAHAVTLNRYLEDLRVAIDDIEADPDRIPTFELLGERIRELELRDEAIRQNVDAAQLEANRVADRDRFRQELARVKLEYDSVKSAYQGQNTRGWVKVDSGTGLYRYFPTNDAKHINRLAEAHQHPYQRWIAELNATVLSGDTSPITGVQAPLAFLFSPKATLQQIKDEGFLSFFRQDAIVDKVRSDPEGWADFAFYTGRALPSGTPEEFAGGLLARLPFGLGAKYSTLNEGAYSAVLQLQKRMFDDIVGDLVGEGIDPMVARAAAGDQVSKAIPTLNYRRLGQSQQQAALQRLPFTSISFIRQPAALIQEATAGFAKMAARKPLTPSERIASRLMAKLTGTTMALAATSSMLSALQAGDDPIQAGLDAIDPTNGAFMAVTIGDKRVPIGGPFRSLIRAIAPREVETGAGRFPVPFVGLRSFVTNRATPIAATTRDLVRNAGFFGDPIRTQDGVVGIGQQLLYAFSGAAPISIGEAVRGGMRGDTMEELLTQSAASFGGINLQEQSAYRGFDRIAQRTYGRDFYELEPWQREALKEQNPDLWEKRVAQGSANFQRAEAVRTVLYERQLSDDSDLLAGTLTREDWRDARGKRRDEQRFRLQEIYGDRPIAEPQNAYEEYLAIVRQAEDERGAVDWDAVDAAVAALPAAQRDDIRKSVGIGQTPLSREYARELSAYVKLPRYKGFTAREASVIDDAWQEIINAAGEDRLRRLRGVRQYIGVLPDNIVTALRRRAIGGSLARDKARDDYREANPLLDALLRDGKLQPEDIEVLAKYAGSRRTAA